MKAGVWIAVIAAIAAASGFFVSWRIGPKSTLSTVVSAAGTNEEPGASSAPKPASNIQEAAARPIPDHLPVVTLKGLSGKPVSLTDFRGAALVVNFWATWCVPCRREIPLLRKLRREQHARGVEVVGIAVDFADAVRKYAREIHLDYPLMMGEEDGLAAAQAFGMDMVLPFTVFADAQRRIVAVKVGELHAEEADLILSAIFKINSKHLDIELAKADIADKMREIAKARALQGAHPATS